MEKAYRGGGLFDKCALLMADWASYCNQPAISGGDVISLARRGMSDSWTSLSDALAIVQRITREEVAAKEQILQKLKWGELHARMESHEYRFLWRRSAYSSGPRFRVEKHAAAAFAKILPDWWLSCEVDWQMSTAHVRWPPVDYALAKEAEKHYGREANPYQETASGVHVATPDLARLWPMPAIKPQGHRPKGTGLAGVDGPLVAQMHSALSNNSVSSRTAAARMVLKQAGKRTGATFDSEVSRLIRRYKAKYPR